jgi:hypothetical protein
LGRRDCRPQLEALEDRTLLSFLTASNFPLGAGPNAVAVGDFNHDGKLDIVAVGGSQAMVLLGNGNGTFAAAVNFSTDANAQGVAVADLNGDGKLDIITANHDGNDVSVLLGNGNGTFQAAVNYAVGTGPDGVAVGDFNGDGKLDLAVSNNGSNNLSVLLGNGNGTFQAASTLSVVSGSPNSMAVGDFLGDGKRDDLVTATGDGIDVLLGNGNGTFQPAVKYITGGGPNSVIVGDFNGDGKSDLALACGVDNTVNVLFGNGDGTFGAFKAYTVVGSPDGLAAGDFNGDGKLDLVTSNHQFESNAVSVLLNNGKGTFTAPQMFLADQNPVAVTVGDFFGSGKLGLVVADNATSDVSLLPGNGNGTFIAPRSFSVGNKPGPLVTADFNGDGLADLAVAHTFVGSGSPTTINILLNNGDGTFRNSINLDTGKAALGMVVGDFNGDGKADIAISTADSGNNPVIAVFLGNGNGTFKKPIDSPSTNLLDGLAVGDFNGDGKLDIVGASGGANVLDVMLGNGNGTFGAATNWGSFSDPISVTVADFNSDGNLDIAAVGKSDGFVGVLLGNGDGTFGTEADYGINNSVLTAVAAGDLNNDGHPDLVVTHFFGFSANVDVLLGNGDGSFQAAVTYNTGGSNPTAVAIADINGDGIPDIVMANQFSDSVGIIFGNGDGTFGPPTVYAVGDRPGTFIPTGSGLVVGDLNGDGKPDVAVAGNNARTVSVLLTPVSTHLVVNAPITTTAGNRFKITVTAVDGSGNTLTSYTGTVHFSSDDPMATLPSNYTFKSTDHGVHTFTGVILDKSGMRDISLADVNTTVIAGSTTVNVGAAAVAQFALKAPKTAVAGTAFNITVIAEDAFGNKVNGYLGTVMFSDSVGGATLPPNYTFVSGDHGRHTFSVTLNTTGSQTLTVEDTVTNTIMGTATVTVNPAGRDGAAQGGDGPDPSGGDPFAG